MGGTIKETKNMNILDLYCGAGGAAKGMADACEEAGIEYSITGIDIKEEPEYPYRMIQGDVTALSPWWVAQFDFIWASPPC